MTRTLAFGTLAAIALSGLAAAARQQPTFRNAGEAVRVFVTVTDNDGRLATTLSKTDFEIRDDGKPQPLTVFDRTPRAVRLIVMLDVSGSMAGNLPLLRDSAANLFAHLAAEDRARVGSFGEDVAISESFTRDADVLRASLPVAIKPDAPTPLWLALDKAIDAFGDASRDPGTADEDGPRPVILVLSDGKDAPPLSFRTRPSSQAGVIDHARRDNVMIYAVGMRSRSRQRIPAGGGLNALGASMMADLPDPGLARVAEETGGGYVEINFGEDLGMAFAGVVDELHSQYLLAFAPPRHDGKVHGIDVRLATKGMKARARKSYVAPK